MKKYSLNMYADAVYSAYVDVEAENEEEAEEKAIIEFNKLLEDGEYEIEIYDIHPQNIEEVEA